MIKLKGSKKQYGFKWVWTIDGNIIFKGDDSQSAKPKIRWVFSAMSVCHALSLFIVWDYVWKHFIFVSIALFNFQGNTPVKNYFKFWLDIFI